MTEYSMLKARFLLGSAIELRIVWIWACRLVRQYSFNKAAEDAAADAAYVVYKAATYVAWVKAKRELANYLKEQDDADVKDH